MFSMNVRMEALVLVKLFVDGRIAFSRCTLKFRFSTGLTNRNFRPSNVMVTEL